MDFTVEEINSFFDIDWDDIPDKETRGQKRTREEAHLDSVNSVETETKPANAANITNDQATKSCTSTCEPSTSFSSEFNDLFFGLDDFFKELDVNSKDSEAVKIPSKTSIAVLPNKLDNEIITTLNIPNDNIQYPRHDALVKRLMDKKKFKKHVKLLIISLHNCEVFEKNFFKLNGVILQNVVIAGKVVATKPYKSGARITVDDGTSRIEIFSNEIGAYKKKALKNAQEIVEQYGPNYRQYTNFPSTIQFAACFAYKISKMIPEMPLHFNDFKLQDTVVVLGKLGLFKGNTDTSYIIYADLIKKVETDPENFQITWNYECLQEFESPTSFFNNVYNPRNTYLY